MQRYGKVRKEFLFQEKAFKGTLGFVACRALAEGKERNSGPILWVFLFSIDKLFMCDIADTEKIKNTEKEKKVFNPPLFFS